MTTTYETAENAIRSRFKTLVSDVITLPTVHDNAPDPDPGDDAEWCRFTVEHGETGQPWMASSSQRPLRLTGVAVAQVFSRVEKGTKSAIEACDTIADAFRQVTASGVVYRTPSIEHVGRTGKWWQVNVACPWYSNVTA